MTKSGLCQTNTPYSLEGYGVSSTWNPSLPRLHKVPYGVSSMTIRRIDIQAQPKGKICNTPYLDSLYTVLMIWTNILEGLKISNVVPTPSQTPICRIDLYNTAYRPYRQQLYKLITISIFKRAQPQFRNPNSKKLIFEALEEQRRYSKALNSMGNDL